MKRLDLIIDALEFSKLVAEQSQKNELIDDALEDLRELRELEPVAYWNGKDRFICADQIKYISIYTDYYPEPLYALPTVSVDNSAKTVNEFHPLDKKADNARELGLDYEPDNGFDRTASHMTGEYMSTNQQNVNTSEERVQISDKAIHETQRLGQELEQEPVAWMMPDYGDVLSASEADGTGIYNIPLYTAPPRKEWVGLTDDEIESIAKALFDDAAYCSLHFAIAIENKLRDKNESA